MFEIESSPDGHEKFKKFCALSVSGVLAPLESVELQAHLNHCPSCYEIYREYQTLATQGMAALAEECAESQEQKSWDTTPVLVHLLERVRTDLLRGGEQKTRKTPATSDVPPSGLHTTRGPVWAAIAACATFMLVLAAYHLGAHSQKPASPQLPIPVASVDPHLQLISDEKEQTDARLAAANLDLQRLQTQSSDKEKELAKLKTDLHDLEDRLSKLQEASGQSQAQLSDLTRERNKLAAELVGLTQSYENDKAELAKLRTERDGMLLRNSSLEAKVSELSSITREQERRLNDSDQYLTSDRDIRELMGARKLYIADVFDVDGSSRTQKPFGRVFYTQGKSLIFYAFDLDREPGVVNANAFQVWGQREMPQGQQPVPMNLGILYMDNETNRRWVMRFDDPKKLAEIDAVFVTVEPRGGSHKPTSKPFLYALLRNEANHP
jgi:Anti-sigma-K factor rskA